MASSSLSSIHYVASSDRNPRQNNKSVSTGRLSDLSISCLIGNIVEMGDDFSSCDKWILVASSYLSTSLCPFHPHLADLLWHSLDKEWLFTFPIRKAKRLTCSVKLQYSVMSDSVGVCYSWCSQRDTFLPQQVHFYAGLSMSMTPGWWWRSLKNFFENFVQDRNTFRMKSLFKRVHLGNLKIFTLFTS